MLSFRTHDIPIDAANGAHIWLDLSHVRAITIQTLTAAGVPLVPANNYQIVVDEGSPITTRQSAWNLAEIEGARSLRVRFPGGELAGSRARIVLSPTAAIVAVT
ncbi:MAG: hypothetical protein HY719_12175 [Planctomycetes bacterium]|nr:hypothetical protein [Planctomycetota bacterium]